MDQHDSVNELMNGGLPHDNIYHQNLSKIEDQCDSNESKGHSQDPSYKFVDHSHDSLHDSKFENFLLNWKYLNFEKGISAKHFWLFLCEGSLNSRLDYNEVSYISFSHAYLLWCDLS